MLVITKSTSWLSWPQLKQASKEGRLKELICSGDMIPVRLTDGTEIMFVVGYDANYETNGRAYFILDHCWKNRAVMNRKNTNAGGWGECEMRATLNRDIFNLLPGEMKDVIAETEITYMDPRTRQINTVRDKLFLLSMTQVFGNGDWSHKEPNDSKIDIFESARDRIREYNGSANTWWLRSADGSSTFYFVSTGGSGGSSGASYAYGVVFGFCI